MIGWLLHAILVLVGLAGAGVFISLAAIITFDHWVKGEFPYPPFGDDFRRKYSARMKTCPDCKEEKLPEEFGKNAGRNDGLQTYCKECNKIRRGTVPNSTRRRNYDF